MSETDNNALELVCWALAPHTQMPEDFDAKLLTVLQDRQDKAARIAALEAELAALRSDRTEILDSAWNTANKRAERAEAHAADCLRLVTACENDLDAERMKRLEIEAEVAELAAFKRDVCRRASQDQHGWSAWVAG